jgi:L-aspartate oxidase
MSEQFCKRRYLLNFETQRLGQVFTDVLVIGAGVAGLRTAIEAAGDADVIVAFKDRIPDSNTAWAQGGIAAVIDEADSTEAHVADTMNVACGLGHLEAIQYMAREGPVCIEELIRWGARFDLHEGVVALGMEGGHSARRIVHALGDATGQELCATLARRAQVLKRMRLFEHCFVIDLVVHDGRCIGAITHHAKYGHQIIWARQIVLASGGAGMLFRETTNPPGATADGHAAAFRAGVRLRDMEFMQFHPTALYVAGASRALISEAVRGEGAYLVDRDGYRFMPEFHHDAELAPRDVVSRSIVRHMARTEATCVFLDVRHFPAGRFAARFPSIAKLCANFDIDPASGLIPVRPAAHYMVGGVEVDIDGRSNIAGLWACGEAASSGVHGANRLASNSLLEGLVFGKRIGALACESARREKGVSVPVPLSHVVEPSPRTELDLADVRNSLRALCWRNAGIDRNGDRLVETIEIVDFWGRYVMDKVLEERSGWETQNMLSVARLIVQAALARQESRGVHYRSDFPDMDDHRFHGHVTLVRSERRIEQGFEAIG